MKIFYLFLIMLFFLFSCGGKDLCESVSCSNHGKCEIVDSNPTCKCDESYEVNGLSCDFIVESCENINCSGNGACVINKDGKAECNCFDGFTKSDLSCICPEGNYIEGNKCLSDNCLDINCGDNSHCENNNGTDASCFCDEAYYLDNDGKCYMDHCLDLECEEGKTCINNKGIDAKCGCEEGYYLNKGVCFVDKCIDVYCGENKKCVNKNELDIECICDDRSFLENGECFRDYCLDLECKEAETCLNTKDVDAQCVCRDALLFNDDSSTCSKTNGIYIEVIWDNPSDVDLHFLRPTNQILDFNSIDLLNQENNENLNSWREDTNYEWWNKENNLDCFYENCKNGVDWGSESGLDNPILLVDDLHGTGPESIKIQTPEEGWYRTSVFYYSLRGNNTGTNATIKVYCNKNLEYEKTVLLREKNHTWLVNDIYWEELDDGRGICHIIDDNRVYNLKQGEGKEGYQGDLVYNSSCELPYAGVNCEICTTGYYMQEGECLLDEVCEANSCTETNKSVCRVADGLIACSCDYGYHKDENSNCVINEVCSENSCTENNKSRCYIRSGLIDCSCDFGYLEDEDGTCNVKVNCRESSCTQENKSNCNIENNKIICSCDDHFFENEAGNCIHESSCGLDEFEPNSLNPLIPYKVNNGRYNLSLCGFDRDVYLLPAVAGNTLDINLYFTGSEGYMYVELYKFINDDYNYIVGSFSLGDAERTISYLVPETGLYLAVIKPSFGESSDSQNYVMEVSGVSDYYDLINNKFEFDSSNLKPGTVVSVNYEFDLNSSQETSSNLMYKVYLSEDNILDELDTVLYNESINGVEQNQKVENTINITIPQNIKLKDYFLISKIESIDQNIELIQENNIKKKLVRLFGTCSIDRLEDNNTITSIPNNNYINLGYHKDLTICAGDKDFYAINLEQGDNLYLNLSMLNSMENDLDIKLYDSSNLVVSESITTENFEHINFNVTETGIYYIEVIGKTILSENIYNLEVLKPDCEGYICDRGICEVSEYGNISCNCNEECMLAIVDTCPGIEIKSNQLLVGDTKLLENNHEYKLESESVEGKGPDAVYQFTLEKRSLVKITMKTLESIWFKYLYLKKTCNSNSIDSQITKSDNSYDDDKIIEEELLPGTYYIIVDGEYSNSLSKGKYSLELQIDNLCDNNNDCGAKQTCNSFNKCECNNALVFNEDLECHEACISLNEFTQKCFDSSFECNTSDSICYPKTECDLSCDENLHCDLDSLECVSN